MRKLVVLGILFLLFIGFGLYTEKALEKSSRQLVSQLKQVTKFVSEEEWAQAETAFNLAREAWTDIESWWALATDHEEIDEIALGMEKTKGLLAGKAKEDLLAELNALTYLIKHIPEKEKLTLSTLF
ncbi:MAG: DUF4363 family protein [Firmicutes bacterium]|nr:DUF4363 family protein [Bacillota bacterium]